MSKLNNQFNRERHGSLYDRGGSDSWYDRPRKPHYFQGASYTSPIVTDLSDEEIAEYNAGYDDNEKSGGKKDWG